MLGCQDFCGYYDWTFHYIRRTQGQAAVRDLWAQAIGDDSQTHYLDAGRAKGLRGLYETWVKTGEDEHCDWTFTLDEAKNVLHWDMRQCPSKGFLLGNDRHADEDYCDHCMGWMAPLLARCDVEIAVHEHNHAGQCWGEMRVKGRPYQPLDLAGDIRKSEAWNRGFIQRWRDGLPLPLMDGLEATDPSDVLTQWFAKVDRLTVLGRGPSAMEPWAKSLSRGAVVVTDPTYATRDVFDGEPLAVLIGDRSRVLPEVARRFLATPPERRPLLMHMYLPGVPMLDFGSLGLPRPVPVLPLLIRRGLYRHQPHQPYPTTGTFLVLVATALGKAVDVAGIDLYRHPSGRMYPGACADGSPTMPSCHSEACDLEHLRRAAAQAIQPLRFSSPLHEMLK